MNKGIKKEQAITLIALVVTIVVLLIFAGVTISMLTGENGIIKQAQNAKAQNRKGKIEEQVRLAAMAAKTAGKGEIEFNELNSELDKIGYEGEDITELPKDVTIDGVKVTIKDDGSVEKVEPVKLPQNTITSPYLLEGATVTSNDLEKGVTITDEEGNEFVWIVVPKTADVYKTAGLKIKEFTDEEYKLIYEDLATYASEYRDTSYEDIWYTSCGIESESEYNKLKNAMLKSVYENGGFYVGKYETGTDTNRTSTQNELKTPKIKEELFPYIQVDMNQAQELASRFAKGNRNSSLMFGIQWDLMCKYIEVQSQEHLGINAMEDSESWGNYYLTQFDIDKGLYSEDKGKNYKSIETTYNKAEKKAVLLQTGLTERNSMFNIYDIAGNVWELTLEKSKAGYPEVARGGSYAYTTNKQTVDYRSYEEGAYSGDTSWEDSNTGFRVTIY